MWRIDIRNIEICNPNYWSKSYEFIAKFGFRIVWDTTFYLEYFDLLTKQQPIIEYYKGYNQNMTSNGVYRVDL